MIGASDILKADLLIVDDQAANVLLLAKMLRGAGYTSITTTTDPHQVCALYREHRYALILLDLQMPGLDGFQVMEELKQVEPNSYLPVLVITAQPAHKLRALKAGAKDFINKPFDLAEVLMRVYNLVEVRLLHREDEWRTEKAEARFIEAQKMDIIGQLAGGIAHDFNNILSVIIGYTELIAAELEAGHPLVSYAEEIRLASERAVGLTRQLLVFSRKQVVAPVLLDLNAVVGGLEKMLRRLMGENIDLTLAPGKSLGTIRADGGYVGQVLMNLVLNARDAMPDGGQLTITTCNTALDQCYADTHPGTRPGEYVMLTVSDAGTGMTAEVKAHMFETFFTTKPVGKGTGLGLTTCQTIVQQCGGHIGVYSELGQGTTFKIYFPRVTAAREMAEVGVPPGPLPGGTETVLVVEDEPVLRQLACRVLQAQGYGVMAASNGQRALQVAREHLGAPIDLVVTDVIMPVMGGKEMANALISAYPALLILFTSGYPDDAMVHQGVLESGVEFLSKPYTPAALLRKVRALLDARSVAGPSPAR